MPIDDKYWGGAIFIRGNLKIPIINSAQPRVYQFLVAWHELFDLVKSSDIISFGALDKKIKLLSEKEVDVSYHKDNLDFLNKLKDLMKGETTNGSNSSSKVD